MAGNQRLKNRQRKMSRKERKIVAARKERANFRDGKGGDRVKASRAKAAAN